MAWHLSLSLWERASACPFLPPSCLPHYLPVCLFFLTVSKTQLELELELAALFRFVYSSNSLNSEHKKKPKTNERTKKKTKKMNAKNERKTEPMNSKRASCIHGVACHTPHASVHGLRLRDIQTQSTKRKKELDAYIERLDFEKDLSVTVNVENRCQFLISFPHMRCDRQFNPLNFIRNDDSTQYQHHSLNCLTHTQTQPGLILQLTVEWMRSRLVSKDDSNSFMIISALNTKRNWSADIVPCPRQTQAHTHTPSPSPSASHPKPSVSFLAIKKSDLSPSPNVSIHIWLIFGLRSPFRP